MPFIAVSAGPADDDTSYQCAPTTTGSLVAVPTTDRPAPVRALRLPSKPPSPPFGEGIRTQRNQVGELSRFDRTDSIPISNVLGRDCRGGSDRVHRRETTLDEELDHVANRSVVHGVEAEARPHPGAMSGQRLALLGLDGGEEVTPGARWVRTHVGPVFRLDFGMRAPEIEELLAPVFDPVGGASRTLVHVGPCRRVRPEPHVHEWA